MHFLADVDKIEIYGLEGAGFQDKLGDLGLVEQRVAYFFVIIWEFVFHEMWTFLQPRTVRSGIKSDRKRSFQTLSRL